MVFVCSRIPHAPCSRFSQSQTSVHDFKKRSLLVGNLQKKFRLWIFVIILAVVFIVKFLNISVEAALSVFGHIVCFVKVFNKHS